MKNLFATLVLLTVALFAVGQCPTSVGCTTNTFEFNFATLPNSGNVDQVDVYVSGAWTSLGVDSIIGTTIYTDKNGLSCSDTATQIKYRYNNAAVGTQCKTETALPVEFVNVGATVLEDEIVVTWTTASELNNSHFILEKYDRGEWFEIGRTEGAGTWNGLRSYSIRDAFVQDGANIYRVKQVDFDGSFDYSRMFKADAVLSIESGQPVYIDKRWLYIQGFDVIGRKL